MLVVSAIQHNGVNYTGVRHCDIFKQIIRIHPNTKKPIMSTQGFLTHENEFLNREDALAHAVKCGQIGLKPNGHYDYIGGCLTSEDLW